MRELKPLTVETLRDCSSMNQPHGFASKEEIRAFWHRFGARGFLNIKEITADMVAEIRTKIIDRP